MRTKHLLKFEEMILVRTKKFGNPSPLRIVSGTIQPWPKSIEFVRNRNEQQEGTLPNDRNREENANFITNRGNLSLQ